MTTCSAAVRQHYQADISDDHALLDRIRQLLDALDGPITASSLATFDQFHVGGLVATDALARRLDIEPGMLVLDAGSGLGGPSRYLAETFDCRVDGVDLSPDFVAIAQLLAERAGLAERVGYRVGDLASLPFESARFDLVWTQHVAMNIRDRDRLYRDLRRVLKANGRLAFYDPIRTDNSADISYPVPWATAPEMSTLLTREETVAVLTRAGFALSDWDDVTAAASGWLSQQRSTASAGLRLALVVGSRMTEMVENFGRNLQEGRLRLVMGTFVAR